jgi:hypothetical protein
MEGLMTGAIFNGQHYSARNVSMESTRVARAAGLAEQSNFLSQLLPLELVPGNHWRITSGSSVIATSCDVPARRPAEASKGIVIRQQ